MPKPNKLKGTGIISRLHRRPSDATEILQIPCHAQGTTAAKIPYVLYQDGDKYSGEATYEGVTTNIWSARAGTITPDGTAGAYVNDSIELGRFSNLAELGLKGGCLFYCVRFYKSANTTALGNFIVVGAVGASQPGGFAIQNNTSATTQTQIRLSPISGSSASLSRVPTLSAFNTMVGYVDFSTIATGVVTMGVALNGDTTTFTTVSVAITQATLPVNMKTYSEGAGHTQTIGLDLFGDRGTSGSWGSQVNSAVSGAFSISDILLVKSEQNIVSDYTEIMKSYNAYPSDIPQAFYR